MSFALTIDQNETVGLRADDGESIRVVPVPINGTNPGADPVFVFRPGGVASSNVYTTAASLDAALLKVPGPKWVEIDCSIVFPAVFNQNMHLDDCTLVGIPNSLANGPPTLLFGAAGTIDASTRMLRIRQSLLVQNTATAVWTAPTTGFIPTLTVEDNAALLGIVPGSNFVHVPAGGTFITNTFGGGIGDGTHATFTVDAGGTLLSNAGSGGGFQPNAVAGAGTWALTLSAGGIFLLPQGITPTITYNDPPAIIHLANLGGIGPSAPLTFTPGTSITQLASGIVRVSGSMSVTGATAGTNVTFNLIRDVGGVPVTIATQITDAFADGRAQCSLGAVDILPAGGAAHTYSIQASNAAAALSATAGQARVDANELK